MLTVVRHGQTVHNAGGRLSGRADVQLDEVGAAQARAVGRSLEAAMGARGRPAPVDRIVSSPLARARATAAAIAEACGHEVPVEVDERWIELDYGDWDGRPLSEVPPETWVAWISDPTFRPPNGETLAELGERVRAACDELADEQRAEPDRHVVVVSHVSPVKAAVGWALQAGDDLAWRLHVATASISRIEVGRRGPVLHSFNETQHLAG